MKKSLAAGIGLLMLGIFLFAAPLARAADDNSGAGIASTIAESSATAPEPAVKGLPATSGASASKSVLPDPPAVPPASASPFKAEEERRAPIDLGDYSRDVGPRNCCDRTCCDRDYFWFRADYLHFWTKGSRIPALVSTEVNGDPVTLFGDSKINGQGHDGFSLQGGMWLDACQRWGIEADYFDLGRRHNNFDSGFSNGNPFPTLRPFFDTNPAVLDTAFLEVAFPGEFAGKVTVQTHDYFQGAGIDLRRSFGCCGGCKLDGLLGYRYYRLMDNVDVDQTSVDISGDPTTNGSVFDLQDSFRARNEFSGLDLGLAARTQRGRWSLDVLGRVSLGWNHEMVNIHGNTLITDPQGNSTPLPGGMLALSQDGNGDPLNIGDFSRSRFVAIPELSVNLGFQVNNNLRLYGGYDIIYWGAVVRAGEQINTLIDDGNIPFPSGAAPAGGPNPTFNWREASYWAQGLRFGAEVTF
jgi:hypothetical protein